MPRPLRRQTPSLSAGSEHGAASRSERSASLKQVADVASARTTSGRSLVHHLRAHADWHGPGPQCSHCRNDWPADSTDWPNVLRSDPSAAALREVAEPQEPADWSQRYGANGRAKVQKIGPATDRGQVPKPRHEYPRGLAHGHRLRANGKAIAEALYGR